MSGGILALLSTQVVDITTVGRAVATAVSEAAARTAIGAQPLDADLTALAALTGTNSIYYRSAADTWTSVTIGTGLTFAGGTLAASGGAGISSLNGLTDATQTFAVGTAGTNFAIVSAAGVHTFNLPDASATARGVVSTGAQTIAGVKTFSSQIVITGGTQSAPSIQLVAGPAGTIFGPYYSTQNGKGWVFVVNSSAVFKLSESAINLSTGTALSWGNAFDGIGPTRIHRDADYEIGLRNATNAHSLRVYNTYTSTTSYERLNIGWSLVSSVPTCTIGTEVGSGGGILRGLRIGSANTSLVGLWGATPIVQPTTAIASATRVGGGGTALTDTDTFDGYTLSQIVKALRNIGALA